MNIVIPMAGRGTRVSLDYPKPLGTVCGKPIIEWAISSLNIPGNYIFITRQYDNEEYNKLLHDTLKRLQPNCKIISVNFTTQGPVCSALLAKQFIDDNQPLIVTNCDQYTTWDSSKFLTFINKDDLRGAIVTYKCNLLCKSFAKCTSDGRVLETKEKVAISDDAFTGIHYWARGRDFVKSSEQMIMCNDRTNGEFYVAPTYNYMIRSRWLLDGHVYKYEIDPAEWWSLGTQEEIKEFIKAKENGSI